MITELGHWKAADRTARLWLRDDDAHLVHPQLDALLAAVHAHNVPLLLAAIPLKVSAELPGRLAGEHLVRLAVHGADHVNRAPTGRKAEETPVERGQAANMAALSAARETLMRQFGPAAGDWYVPPWNRMAAATAAGLPELGFRAVSTYRATRYGHAGLAELNTHVDLMDWRGGRVGKTAALVAGELAQELALARQADYRPIGILSHHLDHDRTAWSTLEALISLVTDHPAAAWCDPDGLIAG